MTPPKPKTKIPNCSGGSEIKTPAAGRQRADFQYQIAPGGARSKRASPLTNTTGNNTKLLRGERDQNGATGAQLAGAGIPNCSGGSEIKTYFSADDDANSQYQIAPGGARSKPYLGFTQAPYSNTKLLRGERDQNLVPCHPAGPSVIPNCSGGSEIKTMANNARADARKYQIAPGGARSKPA